MSTEIRKEQLKEVVLKRQAPGDRWLPVKSNSPLLESLTDALEWMYQETGRTEYFISARRGVVEIVDEREVEVEKPIKRYSIYDED
jgi:hypothetical protein